MSFWSWLVPWSKVLLLLILVLDQVLDLVLDLDQVVVMDQILRFLLRLALTDRGANGTQTLVHMMLLVAEL